MKEIVNYILEFLRGSGWLGAGFFLPIAFLECLPLIGYVFPGGTLVVGGGALAAGGYLNPWLVFIFASIGAMLGDLFSYSLGRWGGDFIRRRELIKAEKIAKSEELFNKYGASSVFWARFGGLTWATIPFISGSLRLNFRKFFIWNLAGSFGWAAARVALGYFSGNLIVMLIKRWSERLSLIVILVLVLAFLYWLINKNRQSIWRYYVKLSATLATKLIGLSITQKLIKRYPIVTEFLKTKIGQERLLTVFLFIFILLLLYILAEILALI